MNEEQYNHQLFSEFFDWQPQAFIWLRPVWDSSGQIIIDFIYMYSNEAGLKYLNLKSEHLQKIRISNTPSLTDEMRPKILKEMADVYQTGETVATHLYNPVINKHGRVYRIKFRGGILTTIHDRTEEKKVIDELSTKTKELEYQKAFTDSILDASINAVVTVEAVRDGNGNILDLRYRKVNNKFLNWISRTREEIISGTMLNLFPNTKKAGIYDVCRQVIETGESRQIEVFYQDSDRDGWYDLSVTKLDDDTAVGTLNDVTETKGAIIQIEHQKNLLDNILKHSSNGISVTEMIRNGTGEVIDATTILANDAAVKYTGLPKEIYLTKTAVEIDPDIIGSPYYQTCIKTLNSGAPSIIQYFLQATGRWLELTISKMDNEHLIHIFTDITPIKEAQLQLERSVEDLKRSNENLEEFAYVASHDPQEPLRKIYTFSDRLREELSEQLNSNQERMFERMKIATLRMKTLIHDLLQYSLLNRKQEVYERIALRETLNQVIQDLETVILDTNAIIHIDNLPQVYGEGRQLRQLFQNLISNALKYRRPDLTPVITVKCKTVKETDPVFTKHPEVMKGAYYLIRISDNGIGFEQEHAQRIFKVFQRLHGKMEYEGTGVGLAIVQKVVSNHNGYVTVESEPGKGSTFMVFLPAR